MWDTVNLAGAVASILALAYAGFEVGRRTGRRLKQNEQTGGACDESISKVLKELGSQQTTDIDILGYSVHALLDICESYIKKALIEGRRVRVLMLSPDSFGFREKSLMESEYHKMPVEHFRQRSRDHITETTGRLLSLKKRVGYQENRAIVSLDVRLYNQLPLFRGVIWHGKAAVLGNYLSTPREPGRTQRHWELTPGTVPTAPVDYETFVNYFEYLWRFRSRQCDIGCVVFDLYETLAQVTPDEKQIVRRLMAQRLGITEAEMNDLWVKTTVQSNAGILGTTFERFLKIQDLLGRALDETQARDLASLEDGLVGEHCRLFDDTMAALDRLQQHGYRMALHTNCSPSVLSFLNSSGLTRYFEVLGLSFDMHLLKPTRESYQWIISRLDAPPSSCLFVGDGENGELTGAREAGMLTLKVSRPGLPVAGDLAADFYVSGLSELVELLESDKVSERIRNPNNRVHATRYPRA